MLAVVATESKGNPRAIHENPNGSRDYGLGQVNSSMLDAVHLSPTTALEPGPNLAGAVTILRGAVRRYGIAGGLEAYNAGPSGVGEDWQYASQVLRWAAPIATVLREDRP